jgi:hypothetical protein
MSAVTEAMREAIAIAYADYMQRRVSGVPEIEAFTWSVKAMLAALAAPQQAEVDTARLDYIERTFSGMTNRERYLPVQMIWGAGCNGRTLRQSCDKYMARDAAPPALAPATKEAK